MNEDESRPSPRRPGVICPHCRSSQPMGQLFCGNCGWNISTGKPPVIEEPIAAPPALAPVVVPSPARGSHHPPLPLVAAAGFLMLAAILTAIAFGSDDKESKNETVQASSTEAAGIDAPPPAPTEAAVIAPAAPPPAPPPPPPPTPTPVPAPPRPTATPVPPPSARLALISASCKTEYGYHECKGFVKNLTNQSLRNVEIVITWVDVNGVPQEADDSLIEYNPILAGQESPWSVFGKANPSLTRFRVSAKDLLGGSITMRDDRR